MSSNLEPVLSNLRQKVKSRLARQLPGLGDRQNQCLTSDRLANAFLLNLIPPEQNFGPIFYLVNDNLELKKFSETYNLLKESLPGSCLGLADNGGRSLIIWADEQPIPLTVLYALLKNQPCLITTTQENFSSAVVSPEILENSLIQLTAGQILKRDDLLEQLVLGGFEFNTQTDQPGLFAKRGSLVDVWPLNYDCPLRLDFAAQKLLAIQSFNPTTKKIISELDQVELLPVILETSSKTLLKNYLTEKSLIFSSTEQLPNEAIFDFQGSPKFISQITKFI